jgi:hypothetical protein
VKTFNSALDVEESLMWPFKKQEVHAPILRVMLEDEEVVSVQQAEVPTEKLPVVELRSRNQSIRFIDSKGGVRAFDMSSAFDEGARYFHMSIRIGPSFAVQPDGILTEEKHQDAQAAYKNGAKGLRFQPFLLPESSGNPAELVGRGLFYRGLHFSGTVTPGNLSLMCTCDKCRRGFRLQSFHAGFSNMVYLYCSGGTHTLTASSYEDDATPVLGKADAEAVARFEGHLPACSECGGSFRYLNPLLCPHCKEPFIDFKSHPEEREREYYGNYVYGGSLQHYQSLKLSEAAVQQSAQADGPASGGPAA